MLAMLIYKFKTPSDVVSSENYYALGLVPSDLRSSLERSRIVITNYHAFQFTETPAQMVTINL